MSRYTILGGLAALTLFTLAGCGGSELVPKSGVVRVGDTPLPHAYLRFDRDGQTVAYATSDAEGRFTIRQPDGTDGIAPGDYQLEVDFRPPEPGLVDADLLAQAMSAWQTYQQRGESSLTVTIDASPEELTVDLNSSDADRGTSRVSISKRNV